MSSSSVPADVEPQAKSSLSKYMNRLPPWVATNLTRPSFKLLARSWVASWAAFLLVIPFHTLNTFGNAAFFTCMSSFLIPPAFPVQIFFYAIALMVFGSLLGWAWGCAAMKVALVARDEVLLLSELERARQTAAATANPDAMFKLEVFQGVFLDTRSSVIYGVFFAIGCFFFAMSRAYSQKLALFSIFGTIFLDIICSYGPLFPAENYTILESFLTSTAAYVAIGCATIVLLFPESLNHQMLGGVSRLLVVLQKQMETQEIILSITDINDLKPGSTLATKIQSMTTGTFGGIQKLGAGAPLLSAEFSFGRFNGEDIKNLIEPLTILINRMAGLQNFSKLLGGEVSSLPTQASTSTQINPSNPTSNRTSISNGPNDGDVYLLRHLGAGDGSLPTRTVRPDDVLPLLHTATADLRSACVKAIYAANAFVTHVNSTRWQRHTGHAPELEAPLGALRRAIDDFIQTRRLKVIEPFADLGALEKDGRTLPRRVLFYAFVFQENLGWCADATVQLLEVLAEAAHKRPRARLWAPKSIRSLWKILTMRETGEINEMDETFFSPSLARTPLAERDPDSSPPTNIFQHIGYFLYRLYQWLTTPEAIYALKYTFVSVALWLPGVFRGSAYTNYVNKGIWALIMAQTTLEPFMADQIYSYISRLTATTAGIGLGIAAWYIGAGRGGGNPYGIAAVMGVLLVPLLFWRIFCPSIIPPIMCGITVLLVIGYSWIDAHLFLVGDPGVGWPVAWRRWLLVLIGSGASGIMMFIPPRSARKAVRLANASMIMDLSKLYSMLISQWIVDPEVAAGSEMTVERHQRMSKWSRQFRTDFSVVGVRLQALKVRTNLAQWEGSMRGVWAVDKYNELNEVETEMLSYLAQFAGAVYHLDHEWRMRLLHRTKFLNPNFIAEVMAVFTLVSRSLRTGEPFQETVVSKSLLDRVFYHHGHRITPPVRAGDPDNLKGDHWDQLHSPEFMTFATGVTAVYKILSLLDRLHAIAAELCGEVEMLGFAKWQQTHETALNSSTIRP